MIRILSSDLLIIDLIIRLDAHPEFTSLLEEYNLTPGGKMALDEEGYAAFTQAIGDTPVTLVPGGSSANMLTTLSKLLGNELRVTFLGIAGQDAHSELIRYSMEEAHITLLPPSSGEKVGEGNAHHAVSFVFVYPDGQRTIATYPGNARALLVPEIITDALVAENDIVLMQASLWEKFAWEFPNRLLGLREKYHKQLWFALPTHPVFSEKRAELFQWLIPSADLVAGNEEELALIYRTGTEQALLELQKRFSKRSQIAFITRSSQGAAIVTAETVEYIPSPPLAPAAIVNTLGAGDTAFAGFAAAYLKRMPHAKAAALAMQLAAHKLQVDSSRLADPLTLLGKDAFIF